MCTYYVAAATEVIINDSPSFEDGAARKLLLEQCREKTGRRFGLALALTGLPIWIVVTIFLHSYLLGYHAGNYF